MKTAAKPPARPLWMRVDRWHKTPAGFAAFALIEAALCYLFVSIAIDTGSLIAWTFAVFLLFGVLSNVLQFLKRAVNR